MGSGLALGVSVDVGKGFSNDTEEDHFVAGIEQEFPQYGNNLQAYTQSTPAPELFDEYS
jgi:hypothetical protein